MTSHLVDEYLEAEAQRDEWFDRREQEDRWLEETAVESRLNAAMGIPEVAELVAAVRSGNRLRMAAAASAFDAEIPGEFEPWN